MAKMTKVVATPAKNIRPLDAMGHASQCWQTKRMTARLCSRPGKIGKVPAGMGTAPFFADLIPHGRPWAAHRTEAK
jgi:hypothetical protein